MSRNWKGIFILSCSPSCCKDISGVYRYRWLVFSLFTVSFVYHLTPSTQQWSSKEHKLEVKHCRPSLVWVYFASYILTLSDTLQQTYIMDRIVQFQSDAAFKGEGALVLLITSMIHPSRADTIWHWTRGRVHSRQSPNPLWANKGRQPFMRTFTPTTINQPYKDKYKYQSTKDESWWHSGVVSHVVWHFHVLPEPVCVLSRHSGFHLYPNTCRLE